MLITARKSVVWSAHDSLVCCSTIPTLQHGVPKEDSFKSSMPWKRSSRVAVLSGSRCVTSMQMNGQVARTRNKRAVVFSCWTTCATNKIMYWFIIPIRYMICSVGARQSYILTRVMRFNECNVYVLAIRRARRMLYLQQSTGRKGSYQPHWRRYSKWTTTWA